MFCHLVPVSSGNFLASERQNFPQFRVGLPYALYCTIGTSYLPGGRNFPGSKLDFLMHFAISVPMLSFLAGISLPLNGGNVSRPKPNFLMHSAICISLLSDGGSSPGSGLDFLADSAVRVCLFLILAGILPPPSDRQKFPQLQFQLPVNSAICVL
jgi:hypothetical protein